MTKLDDMTLLNEHLKSLDYMDLILTICEIQSQIVDECIQTLFGVVDKIESPESLTEHLEQTKVKLDPLMQTLFVLNEEWAQREDEDLPIDEVPVN